MFPLPFIDWESNVTTPSLNALALKILVPSEFFKQILGFLFSLSELIFLPKYNSSWYYWLPQNHMQCGQAL
jgi:hypothetical protein